MRESEVEEERQKKRGRVGQRERELDTGREIEGESELSIFSKREAP